MGESLSSKLVKITRSMGATFTFRSQQISKEEVFSPTGLLPALAKRADQLCSLCLGYGIGASFSEEKGTLLGNKVVFDDVTPEVFRIFCITDVISELINSSTSGGDTSLDELMYD